MLDYKNIVDLLEKHQYLVKLELKEDSVIAHFPDKFLNNRLEQSVVKYKIDQNINSVIIEYQNFGNKKAVDNIQIPLYAASLYICYHIINLCAIAYNYNPQFIIYYIGEEKANQLKFWEAYIKIVGLSIDDLKKYSELTLLCGLLYCTSNSESLDNQARALGINEGFDILKGMIYIPDNVKIRNKNRNRRQKHRQNHRKQLTNEKIQEIKEQKIEEVKDIENGKNIFEKIKALFSRKHKGKDQ